VKDELSEKDLIMGIHSIAHAIMNSLRNSFALMATDESLKLLKKYLGDNQKLLSKVEVQLINHKEFQNLADKKLKEYGHDSMRIPASLLLEANALPIYDQIEILGEVKSKGTLKVVALDSVSDIQNGAAILRTAAFYGIDYLVIAQKGSFALTPSFFRIASGGIEYVKIVRCPSMVSFVKSFQDLGGECIGLSEHVEAQDLTSFSDGKKRCLVLGSEDKGISNAVERILKYKISLEAKGQIKTLNVSVAATVAMERYF
jgi:23S rRNA (guanosine2251-2'-O)-methyltransferase